MYRPGGKHRLLVRIPYDPEGVLWLRGERKHHIEFNRRFKAWEIAPSRFNDVIERCLWRHGQAYVVQAYRPLEICAPACWNALGHQCECSCLGANHGTGRALEHEVSETFAFEAGPRQLAVRLLRRTAARSAH